MIMTEKIDAIMKLAALSLLENRPPDAEVEAAVADAQQLGITTAEILRCQAVLKAVNGQALRVLLNLLEE